jgi:hypothetical protein
MGLEWSLQKAIKDNSAIEVGALETTGIMAVTGGIEIGIGKETEIAISHEMIAI